MNYQLKKLELQKREQKLINDMKNEIKDSEKYNQLMHELRKLMKDNLELIKEYE